MSDFSRRKFIQGLAVAGVLSPLVARAAGNSLRPAAVPPTIGRWYFTADDWVANNPQFPVIHFSMPEAVVADAPSVSEQLRKHGWHTQWQAAPFSFLHFHSTSHLLLTVMQGEGVMRVGGVQGKLRLLTPGDRLIVPAGTGQQLMSHRGDFQVLAAYPEGQCWDVCRSAISSTAIRRMAGLPLPDPAPLLAALQKI